MSYTATYDLTCPWFDRGMGLEEQRIDTDVDSMPQFVETTLWDGCYTRLNVKDHCEERPVMEERFNDASL